jgi:hypothetical protein
LGVCDLTTIVGTGIAEFNCLEPMEKALEVVGIMLLLALVEKVDLSLMAVRTVGRVSDADQ